MESISKEKKSFKDQGNEYFQQGDFVKALESYTEGVLLLSKQDGSALKPEDIQALHSNRAACLLKLGRFKEAIEACDTCLDISSNDITGPKKKALFRRAQAKFELNDMEGAIRDAKQLLKIAPDTAKATNELLASIKIKADMKPSPNKQLLMTAATTKDAKERLTCTRQLFTAVADDNKHALLELAQLPNLVWDLCKQEPLALGIISQVAGYAPKQLSDSNPDFVNTLKVYIDKEEYESRTKTSALLTLLRLVDELRSTRVIPDMVDDPKRPGKQKRRDMNEMKAEIESLWGEPNIQAIQVFAKALGDENDNVREAAVEACATYCSATEKHARAFVNAEGIEKLTLVATFRPSLASVLLSKIFPALNSETDAQKHSLNMVQPLLATNCYGNKDSIQKSLGAASALLSLMQANQELGTWVCEDNDRKMLKSLADVHVKEAPDRVLAVVAEIFCQLAGTEKGRGMLTDCCSDALQLLIHSSNSDIRSSASVALAKMNAVKFDSSSEQGNIVLGAVANLLRKDASEEEIKRGVEALDYVIQDVEVKTMLTQEGDGITILKKLCHLASKDDSAKTAFAYGLGYLFANITMDSDEARREKLREMDVTEEQFEQFEEVTKSKSRIGRKDTPEEIATRVDAFVRADGVKALRALVMNGGGERVCAVASKAFLNCAAQQRVRGVLLSQGAISALLKIIVTLDKIKPGRTDAPTLTKDATHAIARLLITTDPRLLSEAQIMDCISPIVEQIRSSTDDLVLFECLMALTNIASMSIETKEKIVSCKGIICIEYAQFSENLLVRRAATECLVNIYPVDDLVEWIAQPDKCRLWLLLSEDWAQDMETSRAACAFFANAASDPRIAAALRHPEVTKTHGSGVIRLINIAKDCEEFDEIRHRACVAIAEIAFSDDASVRGEDVPKIKETLEYVAKTKVVAGEKLNAPQFAIQALKTLNLT